MIVFDSLTLALAYLDRHFGTRYIFPVKKQAKFPPCVQDNLDGNCSNDPVQIRKWAAQFPECNWGLAHKKSRLLVADIDTNPAKGKQGQATFDMLDMLYGWPETERTTTPSGGFHLIYEGWGEVPFVMAIGEYGLGKDIDVPNYTLIPGCVFADDTSYVGNDADAVRAPAWMYSVIKTAKAKSRVSNASEVVVDYDKPENVDAAINFLQDDAEPAIEGSGGEFITLKTAMYLKDLGISPSLALDLLLEFYNPRCIPAWDRDDLEKKVANAFEYASLSKAGGKTAEADFADDAPEEAPAMGTYNPKTKTYDLNRARINKQKRERTTAMKREAAKPNDPFRPKTRDAIIDNWVWVIGMDRWLNKQDPRGPHERDTWKHSQFDSEYNKIICKKRGSASDTLLRMARGGPATYHRVGFKPGEGQVLDYGQTYNMYRKSDIEPIEGDITWWTDHLAYLFPDEAYQNHLLNWMAWLVKNLTEKPKHALIVQGEINGTGKSFLGRVLAAILHQANVAIVPQNGLAGRFNAWALQCKLVVVEELRASDKAAVKEALHDIITEDVISIEKKGVDPIKIENCFGVMAFTNNEAAITLDNTDRRYLIVSTEATPRSPDYYANLFAKLNDPAALAAVAYSLINRDLGEYSGQQAAPFTAAKQAMQAAGVDDLETYMVDNRDNSPFNGRMITLDDVLADLPKHLSGHNSRRYNQIKTILRNKFAGEPLKPCALANGRRVRLIAINGKDYSILRGLEPRKLATLYEADKQKAGSGAADIGSEFAEDSE